MRLYVRRPRLFGTTWQLKEGVRRRLPAAKRTAWDMPSNSGFAHGLDADKHSQRTRRQRLEPHCRVERLASFRNLGSTILNHIEYDRLQSNLIGSHCSTLQGIHKEDTPNPLPLMAAVHSDHREINGRDAAMSGRIPDQMSWEIVAFERVRVQRVVAKNAGSSAIRSHPNPREISSLLFPCGTFEEVVEASRPARKSRSIVFCGIERLNDDSLRIGDVLSRHGLPLIRADPWPDARHRSALQAYRGRQEARHGPQQREPCVHDRQW